MRIVIIRRRRRIEVEAEALATEKTFTISGHSFVAGDALYWTDAGAWADAQADAEATLAQGLATEISGDDVTIHALGGSFVTIAGHGLGTAGDELFVSQATPGALTTTEPTSGLVQMVGDVIDADTLLIQGFSAGQA